MSSLVVAAVVLLVIAVGVYVATRGLPPPWPPAAACKLDADCPHPETCDVATGACADPALPGLLLAAQSAAQAFNAAFQTVVGNFESGYPARVSALAAAAGAMGLRVPSTATFTADLAAGLGNLRKYDQQVLSAPGCDPRATSKCGYYSQIMALTPASPGVTIWTAAMGASAVPANLPTATAAFPPVAGDLSTFASLVSADAQARRRRLSAAAASTIAAVNVDVAQLNAYPAALAALAAVVKQTGGALYSHYMSY